MKSLAGHTMRAAYYRRFGGPEVVEWVDVPRPNPKPDELLIRVAATTVSSADWRALTHTFPKGVGLIASTVFGFWRPRHNVLGNDFAGVVEEVGRSVTRFRVGDAVFGNTGLSFGTHAQYVCVKDGPAVVEKPAFISFEDAAALPYGGSTSMGFFHVAKLGKGERLLVNGATGAVGCAAIQLAKHQGASVTAVCSAPNVDLAKSLGADDIIDYRTQDFSEMGEAWDVIMDMAGTAPYRRSARVLRPGGRLLLVNGSLADGLRGPWVSATSDKRIVARALPPSDAMATLAELAATGVIRPVVTKVIAAERIADAYREVATGHKNGSVVLKLRDADKSRPAIGEEKS